MRKLGLALAAAFIATPAFAADIKVAVTAIVEHPALDAARDGVKEGLAAEGFTDGKEIDFIYQSAQGQPATAAQIARRCRSRRNFTDRRDGFIDVGRDCGWRRFQTKYTCCLPLRRESACGECPASEVRDTSQHSLTRTSEAKGH